MGRRWWKGGEEMVGRVGRRWWEGREEMVGG